MVELGDGLRLGEQPRFARRSQIAGREDLDRDRAVEHGIVGAVDHAHAAPAQLSVNAVAVLEGGADHDDLQPAHTKYLWRHFVCLGASYPKSNSSICLRSSTRYSFTKAAYACGPGKSSSTAAGWGRVPFRAPVNSG